MAKRANSDFKLRDKKRNRRFKKQHAKTQDRKQPTKKTIVCVIQGNYKGNPYKVSKYSKFIHNTDKINQKLQHKVISQIKKDQ